MSETAPPPRTPAPPPAKPGTISRERLVLLYMVMLTTAAGNTAMQSVMPSIGTSLGVADVWISLAYSWSAVLWVATAPFWARRSDRRGRKTMMALGMVGFISSFALCGILLWLGLNGYLTAFLTLALFALARGLYGGFGSAAPPAVQAYIASRTDRSQRTNALSLIASSFGLGTVIGPALAPLLIFPGAGLTGPFLIFALFGLATLVALRLRLPNDDPAFETRSGVVPAPYGTGTSANGAGRAEDEDEQQAAEDIPDLKWTDRRLRPWLVAGLLGGHAQAMVLGIAGFLVLDRLGLRATPDEGAGPIGLVLMAGAIATLLAQWGLIPTFKLGPRAATLWGMALAIVGILMFGWAESLHPIALGFAIASLGFGLFRPGFTAGASLAVRRSEQGQVSGIVASINGAAYVVAPALGVWIYGHSDHAAFIIVASLCAMVAVLGWRGLQADADLTGETGAT